MAVTKHPRDKWIDYAFTQAVRHQEPVWMAALMSGELDFGENIRALSALLEKGGSKTMLSKLMDLAKSDEIGLEGRRGIFTGIAGIGGEGELRAIFEPGFHQSAESHALALAALNVASSSRTVKPEGDLAVVLRSALRSDQTELSVQALGLIGRWGVNGLHGDVVALVDNTRAAMPTRLAAVRALGLLGGDDTLLLAKLIDSGDATEELKLAALDSLSRFDMSEAASRGAALLALGQVTTGVLSPFLNREGGGPALTAALVRRKPGAAPAAAALAKLQSLGSSEMELMNFLSQAAGIENTVPAYSVEFVAALAKEAAKGNAVSVVKHFRRPVVRCATKSAQRRITAFRLSGRNSTLSATRLARRGSSRRCCGRGVM